MKPESNDDTLLHGFWTWEEMRDIRRDDLSNEALEELIEQLCRHLSLAA